MMKRAPIKPPKNPSMMAAKILSRVGDFSNSLPSFMISLFDTKTGEIPSYNYLKTLRVKVLMVDAKKTFQVNENDQKLFGFEIS